MKITTGLKHFNESLYLESGRILKPYSLAYETYGQLSKKKDNVIVICHALTGNHHVAGTYENDTRPGWWNDLVGSKKAVDTDKFFVICISILGSPFGSTCPLSINPETGLRYGLGFPVLAISDVVRAQIRLLNELGIQHAHAVIGGSLGGMQALCYAIEYPEFAKNTIMLASTYQTKPWAISFNKIAMEAIRNDPKFKNGNYDSDDILENGLSGLAYGRMVGHISFLSPNSMDKKFGRSYVSTDGLYELFGRFEVERYLEYNGYNFPLRYDPLCYLYITKMMNIFDCTRHYDSLEHALNPIKSHMMFIGFSGDLLFPPDCMIQIHESLQALGKKSRYIHINSDYGHDAFLVEVNKFENYIKNALED